MEMPSIRRRSATRPVSRAFLRLGMWVAVFAVVALFGLLAVAVGPAYFGFHQTRIYGSSMGGALPVGSVAVTRTVGIDDVQVGDVVAVGSRDGAPATLHRVVTIERTAEGVRVTTKGDANPVADPPRYLTGNGDRVVYHVPFAGYLLDWASGDAGAYLLLGSAAVLLIVVTVPRRQTGPIHAPALDAPIPSGILPAMRAAPAGAPASPIAPRLKGQHGLAASARLPKAA
jgi:signal peptidase I